MIGEKVDHRGIYASETSGAYFFICLFLIIFAHLLLWSSSLSFYAYCGSDTRQTISSSEERLWVLICSSVHLDIYPFFYSVIGIIANLPLSL